MRQNYREHKSQNNSTAYVLRCLRVCQSAFAAVIQLSRQTVMCIAKSLSNDGFALFETKRGNSHKWKPSLSSVVQFLKTYSEIHGLPFPSGRGSKGTKPVRYLDSSITRLDVFTAYKKCWKPMMEYVLEAYYLTQNILTEPLLYPSFLKTCRNQYPMLRLEGHGSDFCETCTKLRNVIMTIPAGLARDELVLTRRKHHPKAVNEFSVCSTLCRDVGANTAGNMVHLTLYFAENVLLPHLVQQSSQLHFMTGLKFDLFGVASTNFNNVYLFSLPEGHCPGEKLSNEVLSMLDFVLKLQVIKNTVCVAAYKLSLTCDNCEGQNKNCWTIMAVVFLDNVRYRFVTLLSLTPGNTKNKCNAAFGLVKKKSREQDCQFYSRYVQDN